MTEKSVQQSSPSTEEPKSRPFTPYLMVWAGLAAVSLIYLGLLATQPAFVAHYLGAGGRTAEAEPVQAEAVDRIASDIETLRGTIDLFRSELIELRAQVSNQSDVARDLGTRLAAIEAEPADPQRVAAANPKDKDKGKKAAEQAEAAKKAAKEPPKKAAAKSEPNLETGSVVPPNAGAISFGPATVTPATPAAVPPPAAPQNNLVGIQIATGPSVDSLRLSWTLLSERHADSFRALEPRYTTDTTGPNQSYDLIVGPLGSVDEARRLCQELANRATPCAVSRFTGAAL